MATINDVVKIEIKRQSNQVTTRDLETILVLTTHNRFTDSQRVYTDTTDMLEDGFLVTDSAYKAVSLIFSQDPRPSKVVVGKKEANDTYVEAIVKQQAGKLKFFYVITDASTDADKEAIADYVETQSRLFYVFADYNTLTPTSDATDIFSKLQAKSLFRSFGIYSKDTANSMIEGAWVGRFSSEIIGSAVWIYKLLSGVVADTYSSTEETYLRQKNANYYTYLEDDPVVMGDGKVVGGEWLDVMLGITFIEVRMGERIWGLIKGQNKINYTNDGITMITTKMMEVLREAVDMNILTEDDPIRITAPNANDIPSVTRGTRVLNGITFSARLAGAIIKVDRIQGVVYP